jgi:hypothetical protein
MGLLNQNDLPQVELTLLNETIVNNGTWIQEVYVNNTDLYTVACIRDKPPRLYKHSSTTERSFLKYLCEAPEGYQFHKGLAITNTNGKVYAFVNLHDEYRTLTGLYVGPSIENLSYVGLASCAGYFENTQVNFRIRDVWFNETDNKFYAYYDGSSIWKGTHYYVYLGKSSDPFFEPNEFSYLYEAGALWARRGIYAPMVYFMDNGQGIGAVKGHNQNRIPYDFDCDLVWVKRPSKIVFYTDPEDKYAFFERNGQTDTQITLIFKYEGLVFVYSISRNPDGPGYLGRLYKTHIN